MVLKDGRHSFLHCTGAVLNLGTIRSFGSFPRFIQVRICLSSNTYSFICLTLRGIERLAWAAMGCGENLCGNLLIRMHRLEQDSAADRQLVHHIKISHTNCLTSANEGVAKRKDTYLHQMYNARGIDCGSFGAPSQTGIHSFGIQNNTLIFFAPNHLERLHEMLPARLH